MSEYEINDVQFADEGIAIQYIEVPTDIRVKGRLVKTHQLQVSAAHPDYREDIKDLHSRAVKVLRNALEDFDDSQPWDRAAEIKDDEDEERGMGE